LTGVSICLYIKLHWCSVQPVSKHVDTAFRISTAPFGVGR
jgi:hypothetical protein